MWRSVVRSSGKLLTSYSSKAVQQRCLVTSSSYQDSRTYLTQPHAVRISWLKSAIMEVLPITTEVITSRGQTIDSLAIAVSYCPSLPPVYEEGDTVGKKRIDDSWIEMVLPFSEHAGLRDGIIEADGKTVRYGKLFEILDGLAADVGYRHSTGMKEELSIVTACVDEMSVKSNILITNDLKLQGYLTYVGKTSMEVAIEMISIDPNGGATYIGKSQFIMVAR